MSHPFYTKLWKDTADDVTAVLHADRRVQAKAPFNDYTAALRPIADLYVRYVQLVKRLDECYDQVTQPQKRPLIRRLLDMAIGRMLEMRDVLRQLDMSDYSYYDQVLLEHKLTPFDMETRAPRYFCFGAARERELRARRERIETVIKRAAEKKEKEQEEEQAEMEQELERMSRVKSSVMDEAAQLISKDDNAESNEGDDDATPKPPGKAGAGSASQAGAEKSKLAEEARARAAEKALQERAEREGVDPTTGELTLRGALKLLQRHERARQARMRFVYELREYFARMRVLRGQKLAKQDPEMLNRAATVIQKTWRGYKTRAKLRLRETKELLTLGIATPRYQPTVQQRLAEETCAKRRVLQAQNQEDYETRMALEMTRWMKVKAPWLREDLTDQIRDWFILWYERAGRFAAYPTEEEGGGMCIVSKDLVAPERFLQMKEKLQLEKELAKSGEKKEADALKKGSKEMKKKAKEMKKKEKQLQKKMLKDKKAKMKQGLRLEPYDVPESECFPELVEARGEYKAFWRGRDETDDPQQRLELDLLMAQVAGEGTRGVRLEVDEFMRLELQVLLDALARDYGKKKKGKKGKKKKKKGKKKKQKEPMSDAELWQEFDELVERGVIRNYPLTYLKDFEGDFTFATKELRQSLKLPDPLPGLGEVRQVVMETCILPLGSGMVHRYIPLVKSVCMVGLPRSGKHFLANAVCTETGACLFDMSPPAIAKSGFSGKAGVKRFVKLVNDVARFVQPSVLFIDGAEKPFYKKVPKEEKEMKPKTVVKYLKNLMKTITVDDQILVLGITGQPWAAKSGIVKTFERWILLPVPDYSTVLMTWHMELMKYSAVDRQFPTTALVTETQNYSIKEILDSLEKHMSLERRIRLSWDPLTPQELLQSMMEQEQYTDKQKNKLLNWYKKKTPMAKYRAKVLSNDRIEAGLDEPKKGKEKKKN